MTVPDEFEYVEKVFNLSKFEPNPPLPPSFSNLVPVYHHSVFKTPNPKEEQLRNALHLNFNDRYSALSMIIENKQRFTMSEVNSMYIIQFILQSISPPFLNSLDIIDADFLIYLMHLLSFVRKLINNLNSSKGIPLSPNNKYSTSNHTFNSSSSSNSDLNLLPISKSKSQFSENLAIHQPHNNKMQKKPYKELLYASFYFLYKKIVNHPQSIKIYPDLTKFLKKMTIEHDDDIKKTEKGNKKSYDKPFYFTELHCLCCKNLLDQLIKSPDENAMIIAKNQVGYILDFFKENFVSKVVFTSDLQSKSIITDVYKQTEIFLNETPKSNPELLDSKLTYFNDLRYALFSLCLSFNLIFKVQFTQVISILPPIISNPPIISQEEIEMKTKSYSQLVIKTPLETITDPNDNEEPISFDTFTCPEMKSIDSLISTIDHPMRSIIENLSNQPEEMHLILIKLIIEYGAEQISIQNDINLQILLFILLKNLSSYVETASSFFESKSKASLFFTKSLFNPAVTIFNRPKSTMIMARFLIITMFKILIDNSNDCSFYLNVLLNFLNKMLAYPEMFSEFFFFAHSVFIQYINNPNEYQEVILNCSAQILIFQQTAKFCNAENHREFRSLTFNTLQLIINSIHQTLPVNDLVDNLLSLLFEKSVSNVSCQVLRKYMQLFKMSNILVTKELFEKFMKMVSVCKTDVKTFNPVLEELLDILYDFASDMQPPNLNSLIQSGFFNSIRNIIFLEDVSIDAIADSMKLVHLSPQTEADSPFSEYSKIISKQKMTQKMLEAVMICISDNVQLFVGIRNPKAIPLIFPFLNSDHFCITFLKKLFECIENSIPDSIIISKYQLVTNIINALKDDSSEELFEIVLKIVLKVFPQITSRKDLLSFFNLLSPRTEGSDESHPTKCRRCKHAPMILDTLSKIISQNPMTFRSVLQVTPNKGTIIIPSIHPKNYSNGFMFCFHMMVTNFKGVYDGLLLFKLTSIVSGVYLSCILQKDKIIFSVAKNMGVTIDVGIPVNEWFRLSISFRSWGNIYVLLNGNLAGITCISKIEWTEFFNKNVLFGAGIGFVECQLSRFAIFENHPTLNKDFNITDIQAIYNIATFIIDSQSYFVDESNEKYQLYNISARSEPNTSFTFDGTLFTGISNFNLTFTYSKGLSFILSLFSQIVFDVSDEEKNSTETFLLKLFDILCILIQTNNNIQKPLCNMKGFEIISNFLYRAIEKKNISMNSNVSAAIFKIHPYLKNEDLRISYTQSLLLNFDLWKEASSQVFDGLIGELLETSVMTPIIMKTRLKPQIIIAIIKKVNKSPIATKEILDKLYQLLLASMSQYVEKDDILSFLNLMKLSYESQIELKKYLAVLYQFVTKNPQHQDLIGSTLLTTDWLIQYYRFPKIQKILVGSFARLNLTVFSRFFLKNIELASKRTETENNNLLFKLCCYLVGLRSEINDNEECNLMKLIDKEKEWKISEWLLPACISVSFFVSNEVATNFSTFLNTLFSSNDNLMKIKMTMTPLTLFFILCFAIFRTPTVIDFLTVLLTSDSSLCANCFIMVDLIEAVLKCDFSEFLRLLALKIIIVVFSRDFEGFRQQFLDIIIDYISFRPRTKYSKTAEQVSFPLLLEEIHKNSNINVPPVTFYLNRDSKGNWPDLVLVVKLVTLLPQVIIQQANNNKNIDLSRFMILLSFACHHLIETPKEIPEGLDSFVRLVSPESKLWAPILYQVSLHARDFEKAELFMKTFSQQLFPSIELYVEQGTLFQNFISQCSYIVPNNSIIIQMLSSYEFVKKEESKIDNDNENVKPEDEALILLNKMNHCLLIGYEYEWLKIKRALSYETLSLEDDKKDMNSLTRINYFDYQMRPFISTGLSTLTSFLSSDEENVQNDVGKQIIEFNNKLSKFMSFNDPANNRDSIFSVDCHRIIFDKTIDGRLFLFLDHLKFFTNSLKILIIHPCQLHHFYFFGDTFQFFLQNHKCFLFKFDNNEEAGKFVTTLQKTKFLQEVKNNFSLSSTITTKWLDYEINNFDYLLWLNFNNGRSFFLLDKYPIFPEIDDNGNIINDDIKTNEKVDLNDVEGQNRPEKFFNIPGKPDIVNKNRKILENEKVSVSLHSWIEKAFGLVNHVQRKKNFTMPQSRSNITIINLSSPVVDFYTIGGTIGTSLTYALLSDGSVRCFSLENDILEESKATPNNEQNIEKDVKKKRRQSKLGLAIGTSPDKIQGETQVKNKSVGKINSNFGLVTFMSNKFFFTYGQLIGLFDFLNEIKDPNQRLFVIRSEQTVAPITAVSSCHNLVITGAEDGSVTLWNVVNKEPLFKDVLIVNKLSSICSICINVMFGVVTFCDVKGMIVLARLTDLRLLAVSYVYNEEVDSSVMSLPKKIQMTDGLGYILVLTGRNEIVSFSSSLEKIKTMTYDVKIVDFCVMKSRSGIDYFAAVNENNNILVYNAFNLEFEMFVSTQPKPVRKIKYSNELGAFLLAMADSSFVICPFEIQ